MFGFDDNDEHRHEAELFRLSQAPGGIDLAEDALRGRDVFSHLLDQKLGGGELFFLSDPFDKIETHCLSVEISLEIEDVTFDRQRAIAKGRIHPDTRDARPLALADLPALDQSSDLTAADAHATQLNRVDDPYFKACLRAPMDQILNSPFSSLAEAQVPAHPELVNFEHVD